jgi:hypothetical protein
MKESFSIVQTQVLIWIKSDFASPTTLVTSYVRRRTERFEEKATIVIELQRFNLAGCPSMKNLHSLETIRHGAIAGAAGGLAEIAWVTLYAGTTGGNATILARGVTTASGVSALLPTVPVELGVAIHMALAVMLGVALALAWRAANRRGSANPYPLVLAALAGVWAVNFFVVLPIVSPAFIHMVPYTVSLTSKLLFGLAAAEVLRRRMPHRGQSMSSAGYGLDRYLKRIFRLRKGCGT